MGDQIAGPAFYAEIAALKLKSNLEGEDVEYVLEEAAGETGHSYSKYMEGLRDTEEFAGTEVAAETRDTWARIAAKCLGFYLEDNEPERYEPVLRTYFETGEFDYSEIDI